MGRFCSNSKRELIDTGRNKMFAKRDREGAILGDGRCRAVNGDRPPPRSKKTVKAGHGDQGDRPRAAVKKK